MSGKSGSTIFTLTILLGLFLQVVFVFADSVDTPNKAASEFAQAYFGLDPEMETRLCGEIAERESNPVTAYLNRVHDDAVQQGYAANYFRSRLKHVETHTIKKDETEAQIRLIGTRKYCLRSFFTGETYQVDEVLTLVREGAKWKVCGNPFNLISG
jgi:hypothetical protein